MSEIDKILLTAASTLIGGVMLIVLGQIITKVYIEPMIEIRKTIGQIAFSLVYYANIIANADILDIKEVGKATDAFRNLSSTLRSTANSLPLYSFFSWLKFLPKKDHVIDAAQRLIRLANTDKKTPYEDTHQDSIAIGHLLNIENALLH